MVKEIKSLFIEIVVILFFVLFTIPLWTVLKQNSFSSVALSYSDLKIENISSYITKKENNVYEYYVVNQTNNIKKYNVYFVDEGDNLRLIKTDYIKGNAQDKFFIEDILNKSVNIIIEEV